MLDCFVDVGIRATGGFIEPCSGNCHIELAIRDKVFHPFVVFEEEFGFLVLGNEGAQFSFGGMSVGKMPVGIHIVDKEPEFNGREAVTENDILLALVFGLERCKFLALQIIERCCVCIKYTYGHRAFIYHLGNLLVQLMNILGAEEAWADTKLDIEDVVKVVEVPLLRDPGAYDYRDWSI